MIEIMADDGTILEVATDDSAEANAANGGSRRRALGAGHDPRR
jgi:hypothetical protein